MDVRRGLALGWRAWREYAARVARSQTAILLSLSYLVLVGPVWVLSRLARRRFLPDGGSRTTWVERPSAAFDPRRMY